MFVKWSQRSRAYQPAATVEPAAALPPGWLAKKEQPPHRTIIAQLAESRRVDGKSRQRIIAHLGTCCEPIDRPGHRRWFYERCDRVLDRLNLAHEDRAKIDAALAERIPRPTAEEIVQHKREVDALDASFRPDPFAVLVRAWNAAGPNDRERFLEAVRQQAAQ